MPDPQVTTLHPKSDISVRTALARLEAGFAAAETRSIQGFAIMADGHRAMDKRLDHISETTMATQMAVARIEGEHTAERREANKAALDPEAKRVRTWTAVATVIAALVAIPAALVAGWEVAHGVATMVMHALGAHR